MSTMSDSSRTVISSVFSALYAGITTATRFPLIIASPWRWFYSHPQALVKACCVEAVTQLDKGGYFQLFFARALFERTEFHFDPYIIRGGAFRHQITLERQDL